MNEFRTSELGLSATLLHEKHRLKGLDRSKPSVEFVFEDSPEIRKTVEQYWLDELLCPAQSLLTSLRKTKRLLYDSPI